MKGFQIVLLAAGVVCQIAAAPQLLSAALASTGLGAFTGMASLAMDTKTMQSGLNLAGNLTRYTTYMVKNVSDVGTGVARGALNQSTALGSKALTGGVEVGKQVVSFVGDAAKHFPGGEVVGMITPMANVGLNFANKVGGVGLNLVAKGGDKALDVGNKIVQNKVESINTGVQKAIGAGRAVVGKIESVKNSFGRVTGITSAFSSKLSSATSGLSSMFSGSKLGSATSGLSSSISGKLGTATSGLSSMFSGSKLGTATSGLSSTISGNLGTATSGLSSSISGNLGTATSEMSSTLSGQLGPATPGLSATTSGTASVPAGSSTGLTGSLGGRFSSFFG